MWEEIKKHPYVIGGAIAVAILIFVVFGSSGSGGGAVASSGSGSDVESGNQLAAAQLAANTQIAGQQTAFQALQEQIGGAISLATIQAHTTDNANELAAGIAAQQINAQSQQAALQTTLSAQVANKQLQNQVDLAAISSNTTLEQTRAVTAALTEQAQINASVASQAINAQRDIATQSWWDRLF